VSGIEEIQTHNAPSVTIQSTEDLLKLKEIMEMYSVARLVMVYTVEKKNHALYVETLS
jgi:hypothetical protein